MSKEEVHIRRTKAFKVIMSRGDAIQIDEEELDAVVEGMNTGKVIIVKRGVINPSYLVTIEQDKDRIQAWTEQFKYGHGQGDKIRARGLESLDNIFGQTKVGMAIEAKEKQRLGEAKKALSSGK